MAAMWRSLDQIGRLNGRSLLSSVHVLCSRNASAAAANKDLASVCSAWKRNKPYVVKPTPEKVQIAKEVVEVFNSNEMVVVIQWGNMTVKEWDDLKYNLRMEDIQPKFFPNKIACKGLEHSIYKEVMPLFRSVNALLCSKEVNVKGMLKALKTQPKAYVIGGKVDNRLMTAHDIEEYAKLPSLLELQAELVQIMSGPAARTSQLLGKNPQQLSYILSQVAEGEATK